MAALVEVPPVAALLLLAEAPVLVLDPRPEAERADPAGRLVLQVVPVLRHVLVESPGQGLNMETWKEWDSKPCSLEIVSVAVSHTALVCKLLLLALGGEPVIKDWEKDLD